MMYLAKPCVVTTGGLRTYALIVYFRAKWDTNFVPIHNIRGRTKVQGATMEYN